MHSNLYTNRIVLNKKQIFLYAIYNKYSRFKFKRMHKQFYCGYYEGDIDMNLKNG